MTTDNNQLQTTVPKGVTNQEKNITDNVLARVENMKATGEIRLPSDYHVGNSLKAAYLVLVDKLANDKPVLEGGCTKVSIANALLKMVTEGLTVAKSQGAFIVRGNELTWQREYFGSIALAKRVGGLKKIRGNAIFKGDVLDFEVDGNTGRKKLIKHKQTLESIATGIVIGAYAISEMQDGTFDLEVMDMGQIQKAWQQGPAKGKSPAHINFPDQMAAKTVINRACKILINASDDSNLSDADISEAPVQDAVQHTIATKANATPMQMDEEVQTGEIVPGDTAEPAKDENPI